MAQDSRHNGCSAGPEHAGRLGVLLTEGGSSPVSTKECVIAQLHAALSASDADRLKSLLQAGVNPEQRDSIGYTALHVAVLTWGHRLRNFPRPHPGLQTPLSDVLARAALCLRTLCDQGVLINATLGDGSRQTVLHLAVRYRVAPAVPILASYGADVNAEDSHGMTPLHMASGTLQEDVVSHLTRLGARVNAVIPWSGNTPLHLAITAAALRLKEGPGSPDLGCISALRGADTEVANGADRTPLQEACSHGVEALVDALLSRGANIHRRTAAGQGCLFLFLDNPANARRAAPLLSKLLCLTLPSPALRDRRGRLPAVLAMSCYAAQRERLLVLTRQPRSLKDMCKNQVYLSHSGARRQELRHVLPRDIFNFVFHVWDSPGDVSFTVEDDSQCLG